MLMLSLAHKWTISPARELGFALHDVARLLRPYSDQRARELGTTRAQWAVLSRLQRSEGSKQNELAEALDLAPITLGRLIDKLTAVGLVERRDDATDRRANRLYLTEKAAPALRDLGALAEDLMGRALAGVDESTVRAMHDGLTTMKANIKNELIAGAEAKCPSPSHRPRAIPRRRTIPPPRPNRGSPCLSRRRREPPRSPLRANPCRKRHRGSSPHSQFSSRPRERLRRARKRHRRPQRRLPRRRQSSSSRSAASVGS